MQGLHLVAATQIPPQGGYYGDADVICVSATADDETAKGVPAMGERADFPSGAFAAAWCVACEVHETQCKMNWKDGWDGEWDDGIMG